MRCLRKGVPAFIETKIMFSELERRRTAYNDICVIGGQRCAQPLIRLVIE